MVIGIDMEWCVDNLEETAASIYRVVTHENILRLVRVSEKPSLELWSKELFLMQMRKIKM